MDIVVNHYKIAKIKAGKPVGSSITEYYMASTMQKTLDFFHNYSASVKTGYAEVSEIIRVPEKRKEENIYVHFKRDRKVNRNFILGLKREFTTVYLSTIIKNYTIGSSESMKGTYDDKWWYNSQLKCFALRHPIRSALDDHDPDPTIVDLQAPEPERWEIQNPRSVCLKNARDVRRDTRDLQPLRLDAITRPTRIAPGQHHADKWDSRTHRRGQGW
jgi:hypothetical protein